MGKWPKLDKIEMIDGPLDDETYEHKLEEAAAPSCSTCRSTTCAPAGGP